MLAACSTVSYAQDRVDKHNEEQAKEVAREFVKDLIRTRDVRPLFHKWFLPNFEFVARPEDEYADWEPIWKPLTFKQRRRVLISFWNSQYAGILIDQSTPEELECFNPYSKECQENRRKYLAQLFSAAEVAKMTNESKDPATVEELVKQSDEMSVLFEKFLPVFETKKLEQTKSFRYWFKLFEENRLLNYYVKAGSIEKNIYDSRRRLVARKGDLTFGVETPLLIRVDFVRRNGKFKVFNLSPGDGD